MLNADLIVSDTFILGIALGPTAGVLSMLQLWNPAASGKTLIVHHVNFNCVSGVSTFSLKTHNAALGTNQGNGFNKTLGGAVSVALVRSAFAATVGSYMATYGQSVPGETVPLDFERRPFFIPPGRGLIVQPDVNNKENNTTFEWREVAG